MSKNSIERRGPAHGGAAVLQRDSGEEVRVAGRAAVYDTETEIRFFNESWYEKLDRHVFRESLRGGHDVEFLIAHAGLPLARTSAGTLTVDNRDDGLHMSTTLDPADPDVARITPKIRRGDLSKMSIGFVVVRDEWRQENRGDEKKLFRTIQEARLLEVSIVSNPAYQDTAIGLRGEHEEAMRMARVPVVDAVRRECEEYKYTKRRMRLEMLQRGTRLKSP